MRREMKMPDEHSTDLHRVLFNAYLLAESARGAVARGVRHYDKSGRFLATAEEVLVALRDEGQVTFEEPEPR